MYSVLKSYGLNGLNGFAVAVEADVSGGLPAFSLVGLPDSAVRESGDRVRSAVKNLGYKWPDRHITVNLAPADIRKSGPVYDLPLLLAVLEKRTGYVFGNQDVYLNVIGGLRLDETACDLPACLAMASSLLDLPIPEKTLAMGEVGLGGEVRSVPHLETRLREAQRVGFDTAIVPRHNLKMIDPRQFPGLRLIGVAYLREAVNAIKLKD